MKLLCLQLLLFCSISLHAQSNDEKAIRFVLEQQLTAWNNGNLEAFMEGYWKSDSLRFIGKAGITYGWQNTLANYQKGYADKAAMGKLKFDIIKIERLSATCYNVIGKWHLTRSMGDIGGHFTLLFRKINKKWLIIQDHTS